MTASRSVGTTTVARRHDYRRPPPIAGRYEHVVNKSMNNVRFVGGKRDYHAGEVDGIVKSSKGSVVDMLSHKAASKEAIELLSSAYHFSFLRRAPAGAAAADNVRHRPPAAGAQARPLHADDVD